MSKDKINPNYYKDNPIQTFDAITSQFTDAEKVGAIKFREPGMMLVKLIGTARDYSKNLQI